MNDCPVCFEPTAQNTSVCCHRDECTDAVMRPGCCVVVWVHIRCMRRYAGQH
jgi:hypothetical protein